MSTALIVQTPNGYEDALFARLEAVQERNAAIGSLLVVGFDDDDDENEESEEEDNSVMIKKRKLSGDDDKEADKKGKVRTKEQLETVRFILINPSRQKLLKKAMDFATCGQSNDNYQMYNTHTGNVTICNIPKQINSATRKKTVALKFDALFTLTYALKSVEFWIEDNELYDEGGECETALKKLAAAWKKLLAHTDQELGIDTEFTRPGIESLLDQFRDWVEGGVHAHYKFDWRPKVVA